MQIILRLYKQYDLDLIYLAHHDDFSISKIAKTVLTSFCRGKFYRIALPQSDVKNIPEKPSKLNNASNSTYTYIFKLDEYYEEDVIDMLKNIKNRQRNSFIKNLIRSYMVGINIETYMTDTNKISLYKIALEEPLKVVPPYAKTKRRKRSAREVADQILNQPAKISEHVNKNEKVDEHATNIVEITPKTNVSNDGADDAASDLFDTFDELLSSF